MTGAFTLHDIPPDAGKGSSFIPTTEHVIFIPAVLLIGMVAGYIMGGNAVRADLAKKQKRAKE